MSREFFIAFNKFNDGSYDVYYMSESKKNYPPPAELIHVREVSPSRDALFDEMLWALKKLLDYCPACEGDMVVEDPDSFEIFDCPLCIEPAHRVVKKAEGKE